MESITINPLRCGNFTSSEIHRIMDTPSKVKTYVEEKNIERRMGISLGTEVHTREMAWGNFLEQRVLDLLGMEYQIQSKQTNVHPTIPNWVGTKDLVVNEIKVSEIKCYQRKSFAMYTDALLTKDTEVIKKNFPKEYWQIVSNAVILSLPKGEAITYMPYEKEIPEIRDMALNYGDIDRHKYTWIYESPIEALAYLPNNGYYKNLNVFEFEIPKHDIDLLTNKVLLNSTLLDEPFAIPK